MSAFVCLLEVPTATDYCEARHPHPVFISVYLRTYKHACLSAYCLFYIILLERTKEGMIRTEEENQDHVRVRSANREQTQQRQESSKNSRSATINGNRNIVLNRRWTLLIYIRLRKFYVNDTSLAVNWSDKDCRFVSSLATWKIHCSP